MKKEQKKISAKKLPALLKKSYTEKALEKKLLKNKSGTTVVSID